jgi:hypothetical protein
MPKVFDSRIMVLAALGGLGTAPCYYLIGRSAGTGASLADVYLWTAIFIVALLAGYELFFAVQTMTLHREARVVSSPLDNRIPFVVQWVWVYSFVYYCLLGLPLAFFSHISQCLTCIAGGFVILMLSSIVYLNWPTRCPSEWHAYQVTGISTRVLAFIQRMDQGRNCCPSLHCTLAAYTASFVPSTILLLAIPALICLSCLFVKQHSVLDLPSSLIFGFSMGAFVNYLL